MGEDVELAEVRLESGPAAVSVARHSVVAVLGQHCPHLDPDTVEAAELLTSELVSNAVLHAGGASRVRILQGDGVRVEVYDDLEVLPAPRGRDHESVAGRGLVLVEALADEFGWELADGEKLTWFRVGSGVEQQEPGERPGPPGPERADAPPRVVQLLATPLALCLVLAEYHEALLREYQLIHLTDHPEDTSQSLRISAADRIRSALADGLRIAVAQAGEGGDGTATATGHLDVTLPVHESDVRALTDLFDLYARAEELATAGRLLVPTIPQEVVAVRGWWMGQVREQWEGGAPRPWRLPDPQAGGIPAPRPRLRWRLRLRYLLGVAVLADDQHLVVGMTARARLRTGWVRTSPVGMRLSVLVPPRLRERHLAGYATHLLTGRGRVLDHPMAMPLWHRRGREVPNILTLSKHGDAGRTYFIAWCRRPSGSSSS